MDYLGNLLNPYTQGYYNLNGPITYTTSHDEQRIVYEAESYLDLSTEDAYKLSKLGVALLMTSPGTPMLYHGQEFGQNSPRELTPQPLQWENMTTETGYDLYNFYKNIIHIRNDNAVFKEGDYEPIITHNNNSILVYKRQLGDEVAIMMFNFGDNYHTINVDAADNSTWYEFISQISVNIIDYFVEEIPPKSAKIFTNFEISPLEINGIPNDLTLLENFPNPFNGSTMIEINLPKSEYINLDVFDISGKRVENIFEGFAQSGKSNFTWHPNQKSNIGFSSGIYFLTLKTDNEKITKKVMYLK